MLVALVRTARFPPGLRKGRLALATWRPRTPWYFIQVQDLVTQYALPLVYLHSKFIHENILRVINGLH